MSRSGTALLAVPLSALLALPLACVPLSAQDPTTDADSPTELEEPLEEDADEEPEPLLAGWLAPLTLDVKTIEGADGALGIDVGWERDLYETLGSVGDVDVGFLAALELEGRFSTASAEEDNTPRALVVRPSLYSHWRVGEIGDFDQTIDLGVAPAMLEADQDFDTVNVGVETFFLTPVPYSWWLSHGVHRLFGTPTRPLVRPVMFRAAWTATDRIEDDLDRDLRGRLSLRLSTRVFVSDEVGISIDARHFIEEGGDDFGFIEVEANLPVGEHADLELSYLDGRLPVSPEPAHSFSIGVAVRF